MKKKLKMDIFAILEEAKDCPQDRLRAKCQKLLKEHHPDKNDGHESEKFLNIMKVWKILSNENQFAQAKADKLGQAKATWDTVSIREMLDEGDAYVQACRCGDQYVLPKSELDGNNDQDQDFCLECDTCSNTINVTL